MRLADWLAETGTKKKDFAERVGCSPAKISALIKGSEWIGRDLAQRISDETAGAVTANDFVAPASEPDAHPEPA